jgi:hypothetical protein
VTRNWSPNVTSALSLANWFGTEVDDCVGMVPMVLVLCDRALQITAIRLSVIDVLCWAFRALQ